MGVPTSGGQGLGNAQGRISIDTSDLQSVRATTQQVGQDVERNLGRIGAGAAQAQSSFAGLAGAARGLAGALGISLGVAGVGQLGRFALESERLATAFARQEVAALSLAGSQAKLNDLMEAYEEATGGAVDRAAALADVTRLQAVGFANSAAELEEFVRAARGISIATGQTQDFVISQLQLAIANQSTLRLDQLGLGVSEVKRRIDELRASNSGMTTEMAYQQAVIGLATEKFGELTESAAGQATEVERLARAWKDLRLEMGQEIRAPVGTTAGGLADLLDLFGRFRDLNRRLTRDVQFEAEARERALQGQTPPPIQMGPRLAPPARARLTIAPGISAGFTAEQQAAMLEFEEARQDIERSAQESRLDATRQYEEQRTSTIRQYGRTIAREAEDFARQRLRAEQQFAEQLADIRADAARREARQIEELARRIGDLRSDSTERVAGWEEDHAQRLADLRSEGNERLQELEEEYQRNRVRAAEQHRETLLGAAARLDAAAVLAEQRRFAQSEREAAQDHSRRTQQERENLDERIEQEQEAHDERVREEREQLDKRIAQEQEAHERRIQDAREADEQRIRDMQEDFEERKRLEDEDRAIRLQRMAEDHADQLAEMARQQALRLEQINRHEREEQKSAEEAHAKALKDLGVYNKTWQAIEDARMRQSLESWDNWWQEFNKRFETFGPAARPEATTPNWQDPFSWGNSWDQGITSTSSTSRSMSVTVAPGAITVLESQRPGQTAAEVEEALVTILGRLQ